MQLSRVLRALEWPLSPSPSPYEIFHLDKTAPQKQVKERYYQLVKLYHPDKLTNPTQLETERFRKIVQANHILSQPAARSAFDQFGIGWSSPLHHQEGKRAGSYTGSRFNRYSRRSQEEFHEFYTPTNERRYTSNTNFVGFVVFLSTVGAVVQAVRLSRASSEITERSERAHFTAARDLAESRRLARDLGKDERRRLFLAHRAGDR